MNWSIDWIDILVITVGALLVLGVIFDPDQPKK